MKINGGKAWENAARDRFSVRPNNHTSWDIIDFVSRRTFSVNLAKTRKSARTHHGYTGSCCSVVGSAKNVALVAFQNYFKCRIIVERLVDVVLSSSRQGVREVSKRHYILYAPSKVGKSK